MLYYLIFKQDESKDVPVVKYIFESDSESKVWGHIIESIDEYFEDEMINFYKDLIDGDCTKESSDDMTRKELKQLKKVEVDDFKNYMEGSEDNDCPDCYYLLTDDSKEYKMLTKMKYIKKDKKTEIIKV